MYFDNFYGSVDFPNIGLWLFMFNKFFSSIDFLHIGLSLCATNSIAVLTTKHWTVTVCNFYYSNVDFPRIGLSCMVLNPIITNCVNKSGLQQCRLSMHCPVNAANSVETEVLHKPTPISRTVIHIKLLFETFLKNCNNRLNYSIKQWKSIFLGRTTIDGYV